MVSLSSALISAFQYVCIVVYLAWLAQRYYGLLDLGKQLGSSTPMTSEAVPGVGTCQFLDRLQPESDDKEGQPIIPVEDLVLYRPGILIGNF